MPYKKNNKKEKMKIAYLSDQKIDTYQGGAELTDYYWVNQGIKEGLDISHYTSQDSIPLDHDLYVISNHEGLKNKIEFKSIINSKSFVLIVHNSQKRGFDQYVFDQAKRIVWIAPDHEEQYGVKYTKSIIKPPYVDTSKFKNLKKKRKLNQLYIGEVARHKFTPLMARHVLSNPNKQFDLYGHVTDSQYLLELNSIPNLNIFDKIENSKLPWIYNQYQTFFWHLDRYGSYGRTLVEALLCGCNLNVNKTNFGLFKYNVNFHSSKEVANWLDYELQTFWQDILTT